MLTSKQQQKATYKHFIQPTHLTSVTLETTVPATVLSTTVFLEWCVSTEQHIPGHTIVRH